MYLKDRGERPGDTRGAVLEAEMDGIDSRREGAASTDSETVQGSRVEAALGSTFSPRAPGRQRHYEVIVGP